MRTDAAVSVSSDITVKTQCLKPIWKPVDNKPVVEVVCAGHLYAMLVPSTVYVVDAQKQRFFFSAAYTLPAVVVENLLPATDTVSFRLASPRGLTTPATAEAISRWL